MEDDEKVPALALMLVLGIEELDLEGQPYETVATLYHVKDALRSELEKFYDGSPR